MTNYSTINTYTKVKPMKIEIIAGASCPTCGSPVATKGVGKWCVDPNCHYSYKVVLPVLPLTRHVVRLVVDLPESYAVAEVANVLQHPDALSKWLQDKFAAAKVVCVQVDAVACSSKPL
jgi:hypothetical protein